MAAIVVPKKVMAITSVASRTMDCMPEDVVGIQERDDRHGITINSSALIGVLVRGSILETHSGNMRSKAAAKITRVELRKTVPDQPNHHKLTSQDDQELQQPACGQEGSELHRIGPDRNGDLGAIEDIAPEGAVGII